MSTVEGVLDSQVSVREFVSWYLPLYMYPPSDATGVRSIVTNHVWVRDIGVLSGSPTKTSEITSFVDGALKIEHV